MTTVFVNILSAEVFGVTRSFYWTDISDLVTLYRSLNKDSEIYLLNIFRNVHQSLLESKEVSELDSQTVLDFGRCLELGKRANPGGLTKSLDEFSSLSTQSRDEILILMISIFLLSGDLRLLNSLTKAHSALPNICTFSGESHKLSLILETVLFKLYHAEDD